MLDVVAGTCPLCRAVHGQLDAFWACPNHGHKLGSPRDDGDFLAYRCPVSRCGYTRSAPRKPARISKGDPMTTVQTRPSTAVDIMWDRSKHIAAVLPGHIDVKSFVGTAAAALYADAKLMQAAETSPETLIAALMECASLGHRPGTEEYYLTPRKKNGKPTVLGIEGYRGIAERMYRSGAVRNIVVREVCARDRFRYVEGVHSRPMHSFSQHDSGTTGADFFGTEGHVDRGPMVGVYAYAELDTGAVSRVVILSRDDVMKAKESSEGSDSDYSPWNKHERAMWWKTALRRLEPWVPTSAEYRREQVRAAAQAASAPQAAPETPWSAEHVPPAQPELPAIEQPERYARPVPQVRRGDTRGLYEAIERQFDEIGVPAAGDERDNYVHKLANKDADLTERDLRFALDSLATCPDLAALVELCNPEPAAS